MRSVGWGVPQVSVVIRRKVKRGNEREFEDVLTAMYEDCKADVPGFNGASFVRPPPGSKGNEYIVSAPQAVTRVLTVAVIAVN